jgi:polysaccharide biosynthesis transport protein
MLHTEHPQMLRNAEVIADTAGPADTAPFSYQSILDFLRRQFSVIAFAVAIMIALGVIYVFTTAPSYTATADLLIDTTRVQLFQQQSMFSDLPIDTGTVESQVEILKSDSLALAVIKKLDLAHDPEFGSAGGGLIGTVLHSLLGLFASNGPESEFALTRHAVGVLQSRLNVVRIGLTYIIAISYRSLSPDRAAQIANAVADAYIDDQLESKYQAARRAGTWLQQRLRELREEASTAQRAVVDYKNNNNMVDAGGRTINEQQLAELNSQLILAKSQTADAAARVDRVQSILESNSPEATVDATVTDTLKDDVITKLRSQYLELAQRQTEWANKYGANHLAVVNLRNQMTEIQSSIRNELQRIAETYKSDLEVDKQREDSVQKQLDQAVAASQVTNQAQVSLRELEANAESFQALYNNFLQRYMESVQQQSFPITEARVISAAERPLSPSNPRTLLLLAAATMAGLAFGIAAGAWREITDRVFRTRNQVEQILQTECIALIPAVLENVKNADPVDSSKATNPGGATKTGAPALVAKVISLGRESRERGANFLGKIGDYGRESGFAGLGSGTPFAQGAKLSTQKTFAQFAGVYSAILETPFSAFSEALRSVKVAIDLTPATNEGRIIGFTSSVPNEGKSSIVAAVARLAAQTGARTILVDCDLRNPSLSRALAPKAVAGLVEVVRDELPLEKAVLIDNATGMAFLPASTKARLAHSSEILASPLTRAFFEKLRQSYDYILLDFAPLMPIVDVRASTHLVDGYVFIVEWGKTRIDHIVQALRSARNVHEHLIGVALNKVDLRALGRYDGRGDGYYHHGKYYQRYGYSE